MQATPVTTTDTIYPPLFGLQLFSLREAFSRVFAYEGRIFVGLPIDAYDDLVEEGCVDDRLTCVRVEDTREVFVDALWWTEDPQVDPSDVVDPASLVISALEGWLRVGTLRDAYATGAIRTSARHARTNLRSAVGRLQSGRGECARRA